MDFVDGTATLVDAGGKWAARMVVGTILLAVMLLGAKPTFAWISDQFIEHGQNQVEDMKQGWRNDCEKQLRAAIGSPTTIAPPLTCLMAGPPATTP